MSSSLDDACTRLETAIYAQNKARSPAESALALLALAGALAQTLHHWLLAQAAPAAEEPPTAPPPAEQPALDALLADDRLRLGLLDAEQSAGLLALHTLRNRLAEGQATTDEVYNAAHRAAQLASELWPHLCDHPSPHVEWPLYDEARSSLPVEVEALQRELQRQRQRGLELEQNAQRLSRALAAANNETDRLRVLVANTRKPEEITPEWRRGLRALLTGLLFAGVGIASYFAARLALDLPWPWLFASLFILLVLPIGLYAGAVSIVRGLRLLSPDRILGYTALLVIVSFLVVVAFDRTPGAFSTRAGAVATRWLSGALRSPLTLAQAILKAPAPFVTALGGDAGENGAASPTAVAAAADPAAVTETPSLPAVEPTVTLTPTLAPPIATPIVVMTVTPTITATIAVTPTMGVGVQVRVVNTEFLNARRDAGLRFQLTTRFPAGVILTILQGPVVADNYTWWEVKGEAGQGWCADQWLEAVAAPAG